ncbi:MAG: cell division protein ZapA [Pseudomonadota bacterium]
MARVEIVVNGKPYKVTCENGQEKRLLELAKYLDRNVSDLVESLGQIGDSKIILLAALTACDELFETRAKLAAAEEATKTTDEDDGEIGDAIARVRALNDRVSALSEKIAGAA